MAATTTVSTHVLDTSLGKPAVGVAISFFRVEGDGATKIGVGTTNTDGRVPTLGSGSGELSAGHYRLSFNVGTHFAAAGRPCFYPVITVDFNIGAEPQHYHVPLLLSAYGYSTYRGS
jgi:5-hydroxyisourate hydrolase